MTELNVIHSGLQKTASFGDIIENLLTRLRLGRMGKIVGNRSRNISNAVVAKLLSDVPNTPPVKILPDKVVELLAQTPADNPHVLPAMFLPVPGSVEGSIGLTAVLKRILGVSKDSDPVRQSILNEFRARRSTQSVAPWVRPMEQASSSAEHLAENVRLKAQQLKNQLRSR